MAQFNIYYGDGQRDRELMDHLRVIKDGGENISGWIKEACWQRLQDAQASATESDKLDEILKRLGRIEANGGIVTNNGGPAPAADDQAEVDEFFENALSSF